MLKRLAHISLTSGWLPATIFLLTLALLLALVAMRMFARQWKPLLKDLLDGIIGGVVGLLAAWLVSDVFMLFGVSLGWMVILTVAAGFALVTFAIADLIRHHGRKRLLAGITALLVLLSTGLRIDMIYGEFTTLGSLFSVPLYPKLPEDETRKPPMTVAQWRQKAQTGQLPSVPDKGRSYSVAIPGTISGFHARSADVYLPPASLSENPPRLPVFILLAGQPGSPDRLFTAVNIPKIMNTYAAGHHGLAPIVVSPDQNGASNHNSLCVDSPVYGNAETYLTKDVPDWIKAHLPVSPDPRMWAIGGFSQGGTCSTQLAPRHPDVYGNMIPSAGEEEPKQGKKEDMIRDYFGSDRRRFLEQVPVNAIRAHAPSNQTLFASAGSRDPQSQKNMAIIAKAASEAGMTVRTVVAQGSGHDWHTVKTGWLPAFDWLGERMGLGPMPKSLDQYKNVTLTDADGLGGGKTIRE